MLGKERKRGGRENLETYGKREELLRVRPENIVLPGKTTSFPPGPPRELLGFHTQEMAVVNAQRPAL